MSKPLTIEELKALEVGDWVWVVDKEDGVSFYARHDEECCITMHPKMQCDEFAYTSADEFGAYDFADYGKTWLAYKNKEQAEEKGEIVEFVANIGDRIYVPWIWDDTDGIMNLTVTSITLRNNVTDYFCNNLETDDINFAKQFNLGNFHSTDYNSIWFTDKSKAERRLAELKGEKV